jgi:putative inorganic carbon (hco3(-)) transporter
VSPTAIVWLTLFVGLIIAGVKRPVYCCCAYLMTFFLGPQFWWWGKGSLAAITLRWNLLAALMLLLCVAITTRRASVFNSTWDRNFFISLILFLANAFAIHFLFAANPEASYTYLDVLWKSVILCVLIRMSITDLEDLHIFLFAVILLCGYVGFEVVFNDSGKMIRGRLEGIRIPNAPGSNGVGAITSMSLIFAGYMVLACSNKWMRMVSLGLSPLILETVLRCNSRGSYLGLIVAGAWLIYAAQGKTKKKALLALCLGVVAILLQAGNEKIWSRFDSTFSSSEERDHSAAERLLYWKSALEMIADYPMGLGGKAAFNSDIGVRYLAEYRPGEFRSTHNGFLDTAAGWGIQGFALQCLGFFLALRSLAKATHIHSIAERYEIAFLGACLQAAFIGQLICTMFTCLLDGEWFLWLCVLCLAYHNIAFTRFAEEEGSSLKISDNGPETVFAS